MRDVTHQTLEVIPGFVRESAGPPGYGLPPNIPIFHMGARALVLTDDTVGLQRLAEATELHPELSDFKQMVDEAWEDHRLMHAILELLGDSLGVLQSGIAERIGADDARRVATLLRQMEEGRLVVRQKEKRSYAVSLPGQEVPLSKAGADAREMEAVRCEAEPSPPVSTVDRSHEERRPMEARELKLAGVEYVPLPRAPLRWEARQKKGTTPGCVEDFEVSAGWTIAEVTKLPMESRPDTAFRLLLPHSGGSFMIDDLGKAERYPTAETAAIAYDRHGTPVAEAGFRWGMYRVQVHPMGLGLIAMDRGGVAHAYDDKLNPILTASLADAPEMRCLMKRYDFTSSDLKNHTRTVALSPDGQRYLFSVVDSVFVVEVAGQSHWAARLPKQEGWTRVGTVSDRIGTSAEIDLALETLDLRLPVTLEQVRKQYRNLAKEWHPDVRGGTEEATERFKEIGAAAELLSGLELQSLAPGVSRAIYQKDGASSSFEVGGLSFTVSMQAGEKQAADWIYAASFAADGGTFLAGYSGRIVKTDAAGRPQRAFDIGAVPRRIADTGDYLYLLTDTRLYILHGTALVRVMDIFDEGEFVAGHEGFGLLEKKRFRWFSEEGDLIGEVRAKRPIRRVFPVEGGIVVETRMRRAEVVGPPAWWQT